MKLGVNVDHIALLREARKINDPDPLEAALLAKRAGADQITIHLREDRRHINEDDVKRIIESSQLPVNIECSINPEIIEYIAKVKPSRATIVPERREEVTTEGGLDFSLIYDRLDQVVHFLKANDIEVSLFIDPTKKAVKSSKILGVQWVELHTGKYANIFAMLYSNLSLTKNSIKDLEMQRSKLKVELKRAIEELKEAAIEAEEFGLKVAAGHGLNYQNVYSILDIGEIEELNIGQSIVARAIFDGFENAVKEMKRIIQR